MVCHNWQWPSVFATALCIGSADCLAQPAAPVAGPATQEAEEDYINPDRPGIADGSTVVGTGTFQAEMALQYEYHRDSQGYFQLIYVPLLLRLGVSDRWELRLEGNTYSWARTNEDGQVAVTDGFQQESVGVKYHFVDTAGLARPSVGAILRIFPPSGTGAFHTHRITGDFRLAADWDIGPEWSLNPNVGVGRYEDVSRRAYTPALFAMTLNYNPSPILNFFADTGMQSTEQLHGRAVVIVDVGTAYIIGHDTQLDASIGWGAAGATPPRPFVAVGVSERF